LDGKVSERNLSLRWRRPDPRPEKTERGLLARRSPWAKSGSVSKNPPARLRGLLPNINYAGQAQVFSNTYYGMEDISPNKIKININDSRTVFATPGISLLQALKEENIFVSSACGGRGICGLCRLRVLEGAPETLTPQELAHLGSAEQQDNFRLACQITLKRGLRVLIPESFFNAREFRATVAEIRDLTHDIKEIRLQLQSPQSISFKSGQYIQLRIPPYAGSKRIAYRTYSIASPPLENTVIELEVRRVPNGLGTTYIFEHLKKGDNIAFNGPHGNFFLRENDNPIVMIAGGSGMAPIKSMLGDMRGRKIRRKIRYFFGARTPSDIFYADLMSSLETALPDFHFIPAVSDVLPGENWPGETGLVTEVVERHLEEGFQGEAYLCGSPAMIDACLKILQQKKVPMERIYYDKFA